ncbi:SDR family NAD(P)-dependent oxidoreductase [Pandoraea nosoerga]|uniref:3-oxoacyl-[acyl-carrier-protein] reductase FabG n=1 Tax=Pandoraea nosoerga TaxID=2508296 RepID=A0A5E4T5T0_9BURK|nr:SDR family NAD(P)-dependent oxidoreductase [Pandoraea nosoerga]VVD83195.1 3-oxoacyl-[acyl-carrier-protein] reductase FabG [Pandoraea nosoerga]
MKRDAIESMVREDAQRHLGQVALVTGATRGIGQEVARSLAEAGMTVLVGAREQAKGEEVVEPLRKAGFQAETLVIDLLQPETLHAAAYRIGRYYGRLDVLVNNAGVTDPRDDAPERASIEAVERVFATNFFGTLRVTQAMLPWLSRAERGRIVNVSSGLGSLAYNNDPSWEHASMRRIGFNASKAALNMLTVQLSQTLRETSITVNSVDPGAPADLAGDASGKRTRENLAQAARSVVMLALGERGPVTGGFFDASGSLPW